MSSAIQQTIQPRAWALMAMLACIWGGSFLSNRIALEEVGVLTTVAVRVGGAAIALWAYVALRRLSFTLTPRLVLGWVGMGMINNVIPFSLIVWGQQHIPSSLAAVFNAATAVFSVLIAALFFADERLGARKALGVTIGFGGVVTAIGAGALHDFDLTSAGQLAVLGACVGYALSGVWGRVMLAGQRPEVSAAGMLTASALVMVPLALGVEGVPEQGWSPATWGALAYLALAASALAYILFYRILALAGAGNLSLVTLMVVPVAIVLGALVYGEALALREYLGFALLAAGLMILDGRPRRLWRPRPV
jgi:drug/metabolite transporter (DMT)-like permease